MKVEIWSDFTCPFCYMGKTKFELALDKFPHKDKVKIEYASYQLDPNAETPSNKSVFEILMAKYDQTLDQVKVMTNQITLQAKEIGLDFHFEQMLHVGTYDAHRLVKYARRKDKEQEMVDKIFHSYFTEGKQIDDHSVLHELALEVGIEKEAIDEVLSVNCCAKSVKTDMETAYEMGIQGVPFFIFNNKYAISGAQPIEVFANVLEDIWQETQLENRASDGEGTCTTNYCEGPDCD